ncbi:MAG TPA: NYN domain-containing protein [Candidatus Acidoferrum sp.]|nr:NYN domain-containing protein [Candidatus Acidoferrum sp.]
MRTQTERIEELRSWLDGKAYVYIDYANVRTKCEKKGWMLDTYKTWRLFNTLGIPSIKFYFGKIIGNRKSEGFHALLRKIGFEIITKPVKFMKLSIDVSGIPKDSPSVIKNFVEPCLLRKLTVEAIEQLNEQLRKMNESGLKYVEMMKCNFDVEIAADMLLDNELHGVDTFCLWTGDSDFAGPILRLLNEKKRVIVFSDGVAPELDDLRPDGVRIYDIKKLKDIVGYEKQKGLSLESPSAKIVGSCDHPAC